MTYCQSMFSGGLVKLRTNLALIERNRETIIPVVSSEARSLVHSCSLFVWQLPMDAGIQSLLKKSEVSEVSEVEGPI